MLNKAELLLAFTLTSYGTLQQRLHLSAAQHAPSNWPSWSVQGQRWAILTAWNPHGQRSDVASNQAAQLALSRDLAGWPQLAGLNGEDEWQEASFVVLGMDLPQAAALARRYQQAALVWGVGRRAALVWCASDPTLERFWLVPCSVASAQGRYTSGS